jgi:hypothetical protein
MSENPPEGLGLPAPERVWIDEAGRLWDRMHGALRPGKEEGWADWPVPEREAELERREHNSSIEDAAELSEHEQEERWVTRSAPQPRKSSARVYASGGMTFEHNPLTGDTIVSGVLIYEPLAPGKIRLSSKRRGGSAEIGANG